MNHKVREHVQKGDKFLDDGKYEEALLYYEEALTLEPNEPDLLNKKGVALRSLGRYDEAIECFNKSLKISPRDLDAS